MALERHSILLDLPSRSRKEGQKKKNKNKEPKTVLKQGSIGRRMPWKKEILLVISNRKAVEDPVYLLSTSKMCIAAYARTTKAAANMPKFLMSDHSALLSKPKELRMAAPGTVMPRPYLLSIRVR